MPWICNTNKIHVKKWVGNKIFLVLYSFENYTNNIKCYGNMLISIVSIATLHFLTYWCWYKWKKWMQWDTEFCITFPHFSFLYHASIIQTYILQNAHNYRTWNIDNFKVMWVMNDIHYFFNNNNIQIFSKINQFHDRWGEARNTDRTGVFVMYLWSMGLNGELQAVVWFRQWVSTCLS